MLCQLTATVSVDLVPLLDSQNLSVDLNYFRWLATARTLRTLSVDLLTVPLTWYRSWTLRSLSVDLELLPLTSYRSWTLRTVGWLVTVSVDLVPLLDLSMCRVDLELLRWLATALAWTPRTLSVDLWLFSVDLVPRTLRSLSVDLELLPDWLATLLDSRTLSVDLTVSVDLVPLLDSP
jgi:hypothetical protein